jgi:hypothetical protein
MDLLDHFEMDLLDHFERVGSVIAETFCAMRDMITCEDRKLEEEESPPEMQVQSRSETNAAATLHNDLITEHRFITDSHLDHNYHGERLLTDTGSQFASDRTPNSWIPCGVGRWSPFSKDTQRPWDNIKHLLEEISNDHFYLGIENRNIKVRMANELPILELTIDLDIWCISCNDCDECPFVYVDFAQNKDLETRAEAMIKQICKSITSGEMGAKPPLCAIIACILSESVERLQPFTANMDGLNKALATLDAELQMAELATEGKSHATSHPDGDDSTAWSDHTHDDEGGSDEEPEELGPPDQKGVSERATALLRDDAMAVTKLFPHVTVARVRSPSPSHPLILIWHFDISFLSNFTESGAHVPRNAFAV